MVTFAASATAAVTGLSVPTSDGARFKRNRDGGVNGRGLTT